MVATNDTILLELVGSRRGQVVIVTHHFRVVETPVVNASLAHLVDRWQALAQTEFRASLTTDYLLDKVRAHHVCGTVPLNAPVEESVNLAGTRADASERLAPWLAVVVRELTALSGRSRRGRWFHPLCAENDIVQENLFGTTQTAIQAYLTVLDTNFISAISAELYRLVVHSKVLAAVPGAQCQNSSTLVTSLALQTTITSQRSRRQRAP